MPFPFDKDEPFADEPGALCVPLVEATGKARCDIRGSFAMPLDVPFELASPSPSADMLPVRIRLGPRASAGVRAAEELVAPSSRWSKSSSGRDRRLRPRTWRVKVAEVVEVGLWCRESGAGLGRVAWLLCCWGAAGAVVVGAEGTVLEEDRGSGVVDGRSVVKGGFMGGDERGRRSATASRAGGSIPPQMTAQLADNEVNEEVKRRSRQKNKTGPASFAWCWTCTCSRSRSCSCSCSCCRRRWSEGSEGSAECRHTPGHKGPVIWLL